MSFGLWSLSTTRAVAMVVFVLPVPIGAHTTAIGALLLATALLVSLVALVAFDTLHCADSRRRIRGTA